MQAYRFLSWKSLVGALILLILLGFAPESFHLQAQTSSNATSAATSPEIPSSTSRRSTTSLPTPSTKTNPSNPTKAQTADGTLTPAGNVNLKRPSLVTQAVLLSLLSMLPFIIMILTSFLKIVVVLSLLRTALGVQQAPPNQVINGVAFLLSLFIMYPTGIKMYEAAQSTINQRSIPDSFLSPDSSTYVIEVASAASEPLREFLKRNSSARHQALFYRLIYRGLPEDYRASLKPDDFIVVIPSYITGQLKDAFEIGVLIYIPFFVIDLVTSNILLAMGMMMLSPVTISMPLKLFLLVMLDGWTILIEGLVKTFQ
jgi:type III secretion protein R